MTLLPSRGPLTTAGNRFGLVWRRFGASVGIRHFVEGLTKAIVEDRARARRKEDDTAHRSSVFIDGSNDSGTGDIGWTSPRLFAGPQTVMPAR